MLYAGDVDMACNFLGGEMFAEAMGLPVRVLNIEEIAKIA